MKHLPRQLRIEIHIIYIPVRCLVPKLLIPPHGPICTGLGEVIHIRALVLVSRVGALEGGEAVHSGPAGVAGFSREGERIRGKGW